MSSLGGEGSYCITVLWALTAIVLIFFALRIYTRVVCLASYGIDDTFYVATTVLTVAYSAIATVACTRGYGRADLDDAARADTTFWRMVAQTFSLLATGTSKASVGFFLLRIVAAHWHKVVIWAVVGIMGVLSVLGALFTFVGCRPISYSWDERVPGGSCIDTVPLSMALALGTIAADIVFVVLSWIFIWKLSSPRRDKIILASSLSLGLFAAAAGAIRIMSVKGVRDVPVAVIVWSQVETSMTLICVGIPVCLPLWTILWRKYRGESGGGGGGVTDDNTNGRRGPHRVLADDNPDARGSENTGLQTIGGTPMYKPDGGSCSSSSNDKKSNSSTSRGGGGSSSSNRTSRGRVRSMIVRGDGSSDEVPLAADYCCCCCCERPVGRHNSMNSASMFGEEHVFPGEGRGGQPGRSFSAQGMSILI